MAGAPLFGTDKIQAEAGNGQPYPHRESGAPGNIADTQFAKTEFYRNKLEFTFSNKRWLTAEEVRQNVVYEQMNAVGFHIPNAFDKVLAIEKCWLQDDISNRIRNAVRDYAYEHNYPFINLRTHEGMLRNMIVRTSTTGSDGYPHLQD